MLLALAVPTVSKYSTIGPGGSRSDVQLADILRNPNDFIGEAVEVNGEVDSNVNSHAMIVDQTPEGLGDEVLIISNTALEPIGGGPGDPLFDEGKEIKISGRVARFDRIQTEQQLGVSLDPDTFDRWNGTPFIVADDVSDESN